VINGEEEQKIQADKLIDGRIRKVTEILKAEEWLVTLKEMK